MPTRQLHAVVPVALGAVVLTACNRTINTLPARLTPADPVQTFALRIPDSLEIRAVDFDAALYPNVSGSNSTWVDTKLGGRAFVKVHAVHRKTGEQYLIVFEDIARRREPVLVIRFDGSATRSGGS
ncbi:MAG TPA: hypothetical protein VEK85_04265 [Gemmatimonadales bacterium]|nr:hypothetical protein [Gemmatimonadales bacterium]